MTRSVDDLAADVREGFDPLRWEADEKVDAAETALSELVALVGTLTQELASERGQGPLTSREREHLAPAEAAEAALAEQKDALDRAYQSRDDWKEEVSRLKGELADMRRALELIAGTSETMAWIPPSSRASQSIARRALAAAGPATPKQHPSNTQATPNLAGPAPEETT